ncbi:hypothetical protein [Staphylococcus equorum]|uniref:hypothetical protein n=2 Tax=Staphylococcus equorum TaxID=246432 RepID=UPI00214AAB5D|nr:hypothetical protein [Staphylococcus equorum]
MSLKDLCHFYIWTIYYYRCRKWKIGMSCKKHYLYSRRWSKLFTFTVKRDVDNDYEGGVSSIIVDKFKVGKFISRDSEIYGGSFFLKSIITTLRQKGING